MKNTFRLLLLIVFIPLAMILVVTIHETGHVIVARLFGDATASFALYKSFPEGGQCIGCTTTGELTDTASLFLSLGGVTATQFFFIVIVIALGTKFLKFIPRLPAKILAALLFLDLPFQLWQAFFNHTPDVPHSGVDFADFCQLVSQQTNISAITIKIALLVVFVVYSLLIIWLYRTRSSQIANKPSNET